MTKRKSPIKNPKSHKRKSLSKFWIRDPITHRLLWIPKPSKPVVTEQPLEVKE